MKSDDQGILMDMIILIMALILAFAKSIVAGKPADL